MASNKLPIHTGGHSTAWTKKQQKNQSAVQRSPSEPQLIGLQRSQTTTLNKLSGAISQDHLFSSNFSSKISTFSENKRKVEDDQTNSQEDMVLAEALRKQELPPISLSHRRPSSALSKQSSKDSLIGGSSGSYIKYEKKDLITLDYEETASRKYSFERENRKDSRDNKNNFMRDTMLDQEKSERRQASSNALTHQGSSNGSLDKKTRGMGTSVATSRSLKTRSPASGVEDFGGTSGDSVLEPVYEVKRNNSSASGPQSRFSNKKSTQQQNTDTTKYTSFTSQNRTHSSGSLIRSKQEDRQKRSSKTITRHTSDQCLMGGRQNSIVQPVKESKRKPPSLDSKPAEFYLGEDSSETSELTKEEHIAQWLDGIKACEWEMEIPQSPTIMEDKPLQTDTALHVVYDGD